MGISLSELTVLIRLCFRSGIIKRDQTEFLSSFSIYLLTGYRDRSRPVRGKGKDRINRRGWCIHWSSRRKRILSKDGRYWIGFPYPYELLFLIIRFGLHRAERRGIIERRILSEASQDPGTHSSPLSLMAEFIWISESDYPLRSQQDQI